MIDEIIEFEWDMFTHVQNIGGRANCQDDNDTFKLMRNSQFLIWDMDSLRLYDGDLKIAILGKENLTAEKYAYMMRDTDPENYEKIKLNLPLVSEEKETIVNNLVSMQLDWTREFRDDYPSIGRNGRPLTKEESLGTASIESYARGEFSTYSVETLKSLTMCFEGYRDKKINPVYKIMDAEMHGY